MPSRPFRLDPEGKSQAAKGFAVSSKDVDRLLEIHEKLTGVGRGYRADVEVLNKSAIVLLCAVWEAYCEDLADEALRHLVSHSADPSALPKLLKQNIAKELKSNPNELAVWQLAGSGWKTHLEGRMNALKERRDFDWNNPKTVHVEKVFEHAVGTRGVTLAWHWKHVSASSAGKKLDKMVELRGDIAHRGKAAEKVKKFHVVRYLTHINRLVETTDDRMREEVTRITKKSPW
jgi:RiboL-PSP-HEPN